MKKLDIEITNKTKLIDLIRTKTNMSNKTIKQYFKYDKILYNGILEHNPNRLESTGIITIVYTKDDPKLDIIYEDEDLIAINKPSGLLSISNSHEKDNTAYHYVSNYIKAKNKHNKIYVLHRLDEDTSGVLLFAKNKQIQDKLKPNWNTYVQNREYYAILPTRTPQEGTIKSYLKMNHNQIVYSSKNNDGWLAITHYKLIKYHKPYSLLQVNIDTGKRNQIRVHMSENFSPIIGDFKYGSKLNPINRLGLHASSISFIDPRTNELLTIQCELPENMINLFK